MLAEVAHDDPDTTLGWCDDQAEFEFVLEILLEGLERRRLQSHRPMLGSTGTRSRARRR